jgi:hypothetical protein
MKQDFNKDELVQLLWLLRIRNNPNQDIEDSINRQLYNLRMDYLEEIKPYENLKLRIYSTQIPRVIICMDINGVINPSLQERIYSDDAKELIKEIDDLIKPIFEKYQARANEIKGVL